MKNVAAIYARVSSEQQAEAHTIDSQVKVLRERVAGDGLELQGEMEFIDNGYSGSTLVRPELERLRDAIARQMIDRLYVHSPDRLARKYAYQVILMEEFERNQVEVMFINRALGKTPEDELLLQVQGVIAEYEREKISERNRRGRRHAAQRGLVSVMLNAPYGYRYIKKVEGGGEARFEIVAEEARVVRQIFEWYGRERLGLWEVCRRLAAGGEITRKGNRRWDRSTVWGILKNPAYRGTAAFGKTRSEPPRPRLRPQRGRPPQAKRPRFRQSVPEEQWILIPVTPIVDSDLFEAVQEQLRDNKRRAQVRNRAAGFLLQGLVCCAQCGYALCGNRGSSRKSGVSHQYYRCSGTDRFRFGGERMCNARSIRTDLLDAAVWREVREVLEDPERLAEEYRRRLQGPKQRDMDDMATIQSQLLRLQQGLGRLIDSLASGLITREEFEPRVGRMRARITDLQAEAEARADQDQLHGDLRLIVGHLEQFTSKVKEGIDCADNETRRDIIRALVKRVEIAERQVNVVFRVDPRPFDHRPSGGVLQFCWYNQASTGCHPWDSGGEVGSRVSLGWI
jgi:site-specific DNA recombinase